MLCEHLLQRSYQTSTYTASRFLFSVTLLVILFFFMLNLFTCLLYFSSQAVLKMHSERQTSVKYYVGIDVGSASVRAALVDEFGTVVMHAEQPIQIWEPQPDHYEQSSADIWAACCAVTKVPEGKEMKEMSFKQRFKVWKLEVFQSLAFNIQFCHVSLP